MKKGKIKDLRSEYKLSHLGKGVRGKYFKSYQSGTNIVLLSPDVAEVFSDEISVNEALRSLIRVAHKSVGATKRSSQRIKAHN